MELFQELGATIERRWREANYNERLFHEIAAAALSEADLPAKVSVWEIAEWTLRATVLPEQRDLSAQFGDPPITIFNSTRFHIDVYFWLKSTTSIHQHGFCGAFQVLHGGSLHAHYEFAEHERINFHAAIGDVKLKGVSWLKVGDVKTIPAGKDYIHALFHLENPSATIVVRTTHLPLESPQFSYYKPSLALDPFFNEPSFIKKQQTVAMLLQAKAPNADVLIAEMLENSDFHTSVEILHQLKSTLIYQPNDDFQRDAAAASAARFDKFMHITVEKFPALGEVLPAVYAENERQDQIVRRRTFVTNSEHRYFFALLLNVPGKNRILPLIQERMPDQDPIDTILDWADELGRTRITGTNNENALGIADWNDEYALVLEGMLKDKSLTEIEAEIRADYGDNSAAIIEKLPSYYETLQTSPLFGALWNE